MSGLVYRERQARGTAAGLLVLHHGRGADEHDLLPLADALDPQRRLLVVTPRAPLSLGGPGAHWYVVPRVGFPDPETFGTSVEALAALHAELWQRSGLGPERTVLGGFSQGAVMSYALALEPERPQPAGVLGFSGFVPTLAGWLPRPFAREPAGCLRAFVAHGSDDPVIPVSFGRAARLALETAGADVEYHESPVGHVIDPHVLATAGDWLGRTLPDRQ